MKKSQVLLAILLSTFIYFGDLSPVQAQTTTNIAQSITDLNFFQADLGVFVTRTVEVALIIGSILVLAYLMWGGIEWITSGGDKTKYEDARNKITAALFGIAIMASGWALWTLANYFFGIDKVITSKGGSSGVAAPVSGGGGGGIVDCCPLAGTSSACCNYMQSKGDYYVVGRYQYSQYCDQLYINWGLWQQDWQKNIGNIPGEEEKDKCK